MKAVKLYKIDWNLSGIEDPEDKKEIQAKLPTVKGFTAPNRFNVTENVPGLLKKKFGYSVNTFSFSEIFITETIEELIKTSAPKGTSPKDIFSPTSGKVTNYGHRCLEELEKNVHERKKMEFRGARPEDFPENLDALMLGVEYLFGIAWEDSTEDDILDLVAGKVKEYAKSDFLKKHKTKAKKEEGDEDDDDDDDDREEE